MLLRCIMALSLLSSPALAEESPSAQAPMPSLTSATPDTVIARLDDIPITLGEVDAQVRRNPGFAFALRLHSTKAGGVPSGTELGMRREALKEVINNLLIERDAFAIGAITKEELEKQLQASPSRHPPQDEAAQALFNSFQLSVEGIETQLRSQLIQQAYIKKLSPHDETVAEGELRDYFEKNRSLYESKPPGAIIAPPPPGFESLRERIREHVLQDKRAKRLEERLTQLRSKAKIELMLPELRE